MTGTTASVLGSVTMLLLEPIIIGLTIYIVYRLVKGRSKRAAKGPIHFDTQGGADGGTTIPILAAFAGIKGLPWWFAIASNNATPSLVVFSSGIRYRMIRKHERHFDEIERIEVRTAWKTVNIEMHFRGELLTFAVNVGTLAAAQAALTLFPATIALSDRARSVLAGST
jgi:hypothetical protein